MPVHRGKRHFVCGAVAALALTHVIDIAFAVLVSTGRASADEIANTVAPNSPDVSVWDGPGGTSVAVDGSDATITVHIDFCCRAEDAAGPGGTVSADAWENGIIDMVKAAQQMWNDALAKFPAKDCLKIKTAFDAKFVQDQQHWDPGYHRILAHGTASNSGSKDPNSKSQRDDTDTVYGQSVGGEFFFGSYAPGEVIGNEGTVPAMTPTVLAHEIGHLMGLGDDYQTRHSALNGRCGTLMANSENGVIDQQLADRLADIISKYNGLRCWKGTLNAGANWTVPTHSGPATCTDSWKVDLTVVETNKGVTGTATANRDSAVQCVRPQMMPPVAVQTMGFKLKGNRDFGKFSVKFQAKDWAPPGGIDTTGFSTLLIGYPIGSRTIDVPIISDTEAGGPFTADWPHPSNHRSATGQISLKCESCKPNDRPWPPAAGKGVVDVVSKCP